MDVGCYNVSGSRLLGGEPETRLGRGVVRPNRNRLGLHRDDAVPGDVVATFDCGTAMQNRDELEAIGTEGSLFVDDPWHCLKPVIELRRDDGVERIELSPRTRTGSSWRTSATRSAARVSSCSGARTPSGRRACWRRCTVRYDERRRSRCDRRRQEARERAAAMLAEAGIVLTPEERGAIELADFGSRRARETGLQIVVYVNTERVCAKEPCSSRTSSARSTGTRRSTASRARRRRSAAASGSSSSTSKASGARKIVLRPGDQFTIMPDTLHWFQAGAAGRGRVGVLDAQPRRVGRLHRPADRPDDCRRGRVSLAPALCVASSSPTSSSRRWSGCPVRAS